MGSNERRRIKALRHTSAIALALGLLVGAFFLYQEYRVSQHRIRAVFTAADGSVSSPALTPALTLELALTEAQRQKGLMYRKPGELGERDGMLFVFPNEAKQSFWMKNTFLSLDMIFLNSDLEVVGILERVPPLAERGFSVEANSQYVVELLAGSAEKWGIKVGSKFVPRKEIPMVTR